MMISRLHDLIGSSNDNVDRDRLSKMPDDIIVRILSYLPIIDAVRTVLLRRFGNLWTLIHTLDFDMGEYINNFCHLRKGCRKHIQWFYVFIRNVVMRHQNLSIQRFHLCIDTRVDLKPSDERERGDLDIRTWWSFALCRQAKEISISEKYNNDFCSSSILPKFTSQFLVTLELDFYKFEGEFQVEFRSLKKLSLNRVWISNENFKRFISGCPSLHELVISNPFVMKKLSLIAPNIDKLSLVLTDLRYLASLLLYVPKLKSLYLENKNWQLDIVDVSSVRNIYIKYSNFFSVLSINQVSLGKFEGIEVFRLSRGPSKDFLHSITKLQLLQYKWTRIVLELHDFCQFCLLGIYHLMNSLQHLEELVIYTTEEFKTNGDHLLRMDLPTSYVTPQLKTITLYGYGKSWKSQLQLVELFLRSAAALDKLIIVPMNYRWEEEEELEVVKQVSSFPRASPNARVIFS